MLFFVLIYALQISMLVDSNLSGIMIITFSDLKLSINNSKVYFLPCDLTEKIILLSLLELLSNKEHEFQNDTKLIFGINLSICSLTSNLRLK